MKKHPCPAYLKLAGDVIISLDPAAPQSLDYLERCRDLALRLESAAEQSQTMRAVDPDVSLRDKLDLPPRCMRVFFPLNLLAVPTYYVAYAIMALAAFVVTVLQDGPITEGEAEAERVDEAARRR